MNLVNEINQSKNNEYKNLGIIAGLACVAATGIGFGLSLPLLSFVMKNLGYSSTIIGLNTAMPAIAAFLLAPLFVKLMEKYGLKVFIILCIFISVSTFFGFYFTQNIILWFIIRFIF
jgi:MFS family permease